MHYQFIAGLVEQLNVKFEFLSFFSQASRSLLNFTLQLRRSIFEFDFAIFQGVKHIVELPSQLRQLMMIIQPQWTNTFLFAKLNELNDFMNALNWSEQITRTAIDHHARDQ